MCNGSEERSRLNNAVPGVPEVSDFINERPGNSFTNSRGWDLFWGPVYRRPRRNSRNDTGNACACAIPTWLSLGRSKSEEGPRYPWTLRVGYTGHDRLLYVRLDWTRRSDSVTLRGLGKGSEWEEGIPLVVWRSLASVPGTCPISRLRRWRMDTTRTSLVL